MVRQAKVMSVKQDETTYFYKVLLPLSGEESIEVSLAGGPYSKLTKQSYISVIYDPENPKEVYWDDVDTHFNWWGAISLIIIIIIFGGAIVFAYKLYKNGNLV